MRCSGVTGEVSPFQTSSARNWKRFTSTQRVITQRPGFDWDARVMLFPGFAAHIHDAYIAGSGLLKVALFGLIPLADLLESTDLSRGELMRYLAASPLAACTTADSSASYEAAVSQIWRPSSNLMNGNMALPRELVRCAMLAPSGHNTQCWKFHVELDTISILPDFARRTPVVDPDDHHLFVSLGCALENLAHASLAHGLQSQAQFDTATNALTIKLVQTPALASPLFKAIPDRQCTRGLYDGKPLSVLELKTQRKNAIITSA